MTQHADGSADFVTADGHVGRISMGSDGSTIVSMPWYSANPVVMKKATFDGLVAAGRTSGSKSSSVRTTLLLVNQPQSACTGMVRALQSAQQAYNAALVMMIVTFGAGIIADIATMGAALIAVGMNVAVVMAWSAAASALSDAQANVAANGC
jgi:prefoldin subunit 5